MAETTQENKITAFYFGMERRLEENLDTVSYS